MLVREMARSDIDGLGDNIHNLRIIEEVYSEDHRKWLELASLRIEAT